MLRLPNAKKVLISRNGVNMWKKPCVTSSRYADNLSKELPHTPRYPLELFCRAVRVSLETLKIVNNLPKLEILTTE